MIKLKIKTGDTVQVIAGDHKGEKGKVLKVDREKNKAIVESYIKAYQTQRTKPTRRYYKKRSSYPNIQSISPRS